MPIAFTKMKQFEAQGKQLQGVAAGAAAGSVMKAGTTDLIRTTRSVLLSSPEQSRLLPMHTLKMEPMDDDEEDYPKFDIRT